MTCLRNRMRLGSLLSVTLTLLRCLTLVCVCQPIVVRISRMASVNDLVEQVNEIIVQQNRAGRGTVSLLWLLTVSLRPRVCLSVCLSVTQSAAAYVCASCA